MGTSHLQQTLDRLRARYGTQQLHEAANPLESLLLAVLDDGALRGKADEALRNLSEAGLLDARQLAASSVDELAELVEPAGNARKKANRLHQLIKFVVDRYDASPAALFETDAETLRRELLTLRGIGQETADAILLLAAKKPSFIVDLAAHRVLKRHGWVEFEADYSAIKEYVEGGFDREPEKLAEFHALVNRVGREHCRKAPLCEGCPLVDLLPPSGPLEAEY
jgi:endonuclease-3 related protein